MATTVYHHLPGWWSKTDSDVKMESSHAHLEIGKGVGTQPCHLAAASFVMTRVYLQDSDLRQENTTSAEVLMTHDCTHTWVHENHEKQAHPPIPQNPWLPFPSQHLPWKTLSLFVKCIEVQIQGNTPLKISEPKHSSFFPWTKGHMTAARSQSLMAKCARENRTQSAASLYFVIFISPAHFSL